MINTACICLKISVIIVLFIVSTVYQCLLYYYHKPIRLTRASSICALHFLSKTQLKCCLCSYMIINIIVFTE